MASNRVTALHAFVRRFLTWRDCSPEDAKAFSVYARGVTVRLTEIFCTVFLLALPVYYLVDRVALGPGPELEASVRWRLGTGAILLSGVLGARAMRITQRDAAAYPLGILGGTVMCFIIGASNARTAHWGGVTTSAFLILPMMSVPVLGSLSLRVVATLLPSASVIAGFVWREPSHMHAPGFAYFLSVMAFACVLSLGTGHALSHMVRRGFLLSRELSVLARSLEQRVQDRTRELQDLFDQLDGAREQERLRIARDVHDELGQLLSASALALDRARLRDQHEVREEETARARVLIGQAIEAVSAILANMRPRALDEAGLVGAFEWLLDQHERDTGTACLWSIDFDASTLPSAHAVVVFRTLQECMRNVARHAQAKQVHVVLSASAGAIRLEVRDDGVGFVPSARRDGSFGLLGMRERAQSLGGSLAVDSVVGQGTTILLTLPWEEAAS